jgi:enoyl-[acyl-carrier-protein] reductase (NADH)
VHMVAPEDIADPMLLLVSAWASAIAGQVIAVDGGAGRGIMHGRAHVTPTPGAGHASAARRWR